MRNFFLISILAVWFSNSTRLAEAAQPPVASTVYNVSNVVELLHMNPKLLSSANLAGVVVYGLSSTQRFSSGRLMRYDPTSAEPESVGYIYAPTNGVGRWKFVDAESAVPFSPVWTGGEPELDVIAYTNRLTWQGIMVDSGPAIQAAIDRVAARGGGVVELDPGEWRLGDLLSPGTLDLKPRVGLQSSGGLPIGEDTFEGTFTSTNIARTFHNTVLHFSSGLTNGNGAPGIRIDQKYYSNMMYTAYVDRAGNWVSYRRGGNFIRGISIDVGWKWAWNGPNPAAAGIYINQVAGTTIEDCTILPTTGPGILVYGGFGTRIRRNTITSSLSCGIVILDTSDTTIEDNTISATRGAPIAIAWANTHTIKRNQLWNNAEDLVGWVGTSQTISTNTPYVINGAVRRTGWSVDPSTDIFTVTNRMGSDTGMPVQVRGTSLPGGLDTNTVYFVRWGPQNGTTFYLCKTAGLALQEGATTVIDVTTAGGSGTWWLEGPSSLVWVRNSEEINLEGTRMDQSWQGAIDWADVSRSRISGNWIWELGLNQTTARQNRDTTWDDPYIRGILLNRCYDVQIIGNMLIGSKGYTSLAVPWDHVPIGVELRSSAGISLSGNYFNRLDTGILIDTNSGWVNTDDRQFGPYVSRPIEGPDTFGVVPNYPYFNAKTNSQIVASLPASQTNITGDFSVSALLRIPILSTNGFANGRHTAIINLTSVTNTTGYGALVPKCFVMSVWRSPVNGSYNLVATLGGTNYDQSNGSTERYANGTDVSPFAGQDVEIVFQRRTNMFQMYVNGFLRLNATINNSTTGNVYAPYVVCGQMGDAGQFSHPQGPIYRLMLQRNSFTTQEINAGLNWATAGGTNAVFMWDFAGASLARGVRDVSGNGVSGTVQQIGAVAPEFGPTSDWIMEPGLNMTITRPSQRRYVFTSSGGGGGGLSDGSYGDITVSGGATVMSVNANAVALSTDTTGNYLAGLSGTANEVSVSGSGSEGATPTVSLPATLDLSGKTSLRVPANSAPTIANAGEIAFDTDLWGASRGGFVGYDGTAAIRSIFVLASDTPVNGQTIKYNTGGFFTFEDDLQGGGGVSDGDKGDITISGSGTTYSVDPDAVALGTDTTGNYVATIAGTANEITVTGSGSENATPTLSLPATVDLGGKTSFEVPNNSAPTVDATGEIAFDTDLWAASRAGVIAYDGTSVIRLIGVLASDTPANGDTIKFNTGGTFTFEPDNAGGVSDGDKGDVTVSGSGTTFTVDNSAITYAKIQNVSASKILGRGDSGTGAPQELTIGSGLSVVGTTISVTATSGGTATPGVISRSATTVTVQNTTTETELLDVVIPGGTLNANGDEVEVYVPSKYTMYTGLANAYRWDFYLDYNDTPTATTGDYTGLAFNSTYYAQVWTARIKRISSTTCTVMVRHILGSDDSSDKTNVIDQLRFIKDYTLTGSKTFADDFNIGLTVTLGEANMGLLVETAGYTVSKVGVGGGSAKMQIAHFTAMDNQPPAANYATFNTRNSMAVLEFDPSTEESARGVFVIPEGADLSGGIKVKITWTTAATSGDVRWGAQVMRLNTDIDSDSFDTAVEATTTCNGTSGIPATTSLTITTIDGAVAGDPIAIRFYRDVTDSADTVNSNDAQLLAADISAVN